MSSKPQPLPKTEKNPKKTKKDTKSTENKNKNKDPFFTNAQQDKTQNDGQPPQMPLLCLIIMIKDGKSVIGNTLRAALPNMDRWFILDTGSADGTQEYIKKIIQSEFSHLPGRIVEEPFVNFEVSRSRAIELAGKECMFQIFLDDSYMLRNGEVLRAFLNLKRNATDEEGYMIKIGKRHTKAYTYPSARIFRSTENVRYEGVVHEVPTCDAHIIVPEPCHIDDGKSAETAERSQKRYTRDLSLLLPEVKAKRGNYTRNVFYLAQTYACLRNFEKAIEWYTYRAKMDPDHEKGFWGETFMAYLRMGYIAQKYLKWEWPKCLDYYLCAHGVDPTRWEPLFRIAKFYKKHAQCSDTIKWNLAHSFSHLAIDNSDDYHPNDLFVNGDIYARKMPTMYSLSAWYSGFYGKTKVHHEQARELLLKTIQNGQKTKDGKRITKNRIYDLECFDDCLKVQKVDTKYKYPAKIIGEIMNRLEQQKNQQSQQSQPNPHNNQYTKHPVTLTMTTCKRLDLFMKTINSFLTCCTDLDQIGRWILVDDNSSESDRHAMGKLYPFFEFVFKTPDQKGHAKSMNMLMEMTKLSTTSSISGTSGYIFHLEDDWLFIEKRPYLTLLLDVFASEPVGCGQVLINRNYGERLHDDPVRVVGGFHKETRHEVKYVAHQHIDREKSPQEYQAFTNTFLPHQGSHAYWPHYSLRPGLMKRGVWYQLGPYDESHRHFEMEYAKRYTESGHTTAFLDGIFSLHIGKLTTEKESDVPSAYALNKTERF